MKSSHLLLPTDVPHLLAPDSSLSHVSGAVIMCKAYVLKIYMWYTCNLTANSVCVCVCVCVCVYIHT